MSDVYGAINANFDPRSDPLGAPAVSPSPAKFPKQPTVDYDAMIKRQEQLGDEGLATMRRGMEESAAARKDLTSAQADYTRTAKGALEKLSKGQKETPEFNPKDISAATNNYMMFAAAMASIAGAFGRYHSTTAFNAFAGAMQGWYQGNLQGFEQEYAKWKASDTAARSHNEKLSTQYQAIMQSAKLNLDQKMMQVQMVAAANQDQMAYQLATQRNFTQLAALMEKRDELQIRHEDAAAKLELGYTKMQLEITKAQAALDKAEKTTFNSPEGLEKFTQRLQQLAASQDPKDRARARMMAQLYVQAHPGGTPQTVDTDEMLKVPGAAGAAAGEDKGVISRVWDRIKGVADGAAAKPPAASAPAGPGASPDVGAMPAAAAPAAPPAAAAASPAAPALNPRTVNAVVSVNRQMGRDGKTPQRALRLSQNNRAIAEFRSLPPGTWVINPSDGRPIQVPTGGPTETMAGP